jgi:hypothetical protein
MYSMLLPVLSGALGACIFMAFGFSFTEMEIVPVKIRTPMVVLAAFAVAFGSTFGSIGSGIEIFRKRYKGETEPWDWISLGVSSITTIAGFGMGFAALLGATEGWSAAANAYGSLVVGTLAGLDSLGDLIELGGLFGSYEIRIETWIQEKRKHELEHGAVEMVVLPEKEELVFDPSWPEANIDEVRQIVASLNGDRATLSASTLLQMLHAKQRRPKSDGTTKRWARLARNGEL